MLTLTQINRINALLPGESTKIGHHLLVCHESLPYLSGTCCSHCALHHTGCYGISCLKGMLVRKTIPNDPEPLEIVRPHDVYFTLYLQ